MNKMDTDFTEELDPAYLPATHLLEDCACFQLRMASRAVTRLFDEIMEPSGLRATQFSILAAIDDMGSLTVKALATSLVMDSSTVVRNLKPLERSRMIMILTDTDRRRKIVQLTPEGAIKLAAALPLWHKAHDGLRGLVGEDLLVTNGVNMKRLVRSVSAMNRGV